MVINFGTEYGKEPFGFKKAVVYTVLVVTVLVVFFLPIKSHVALYRTTMRADIVVPCFSTLGTTYRPFHGYSPFRGPIIRDRWQGAKFYFMTGRLKRG